MITFFRNLRKNLLTEGKLKSYLIYALGEIILVVLGILIALAINNAQQEGQLKKKEITYLRGLQKEFEISKRKLDTLIEVNRSNYMGALKVVALTSGPENKADEQGISQLVFESLNRDIAFNPNNALLSEMMNSGSLKDLSNTELRKHLTNWLSTLEDIAKQESDLKSQRDHVLDMMRNNDSHLKTILHYSVGRNDLPPLTFKTPLNSNMNLFLSPAFENNLLLFILSSQSTEKAHYLPLMNDLTNILKLINTQLQPE